MVRVPVLVTATALTVVCAVVGAAQYLDLSGDPVTAPNVVYLAARSFAMELDTIGGNGPYPMTLDVARLLGPLLLGYATLAALLRVFGQAYDEGRARLRRGHAVVCGLGELGTEAVRALRCQGHQVVVIDPAAAPEAVDQARELGAIVLVADASNQATLELARVWRADRVLVVCGDDQANVEVLAAVRQVIDRAGDRSVAVQVELLSAELADKMHAWTMAHETPGHAVVETFCLPDLAARRLLVRHPPFDAEATEAAVSVVGAGPVARAVVLQLVRLWRAVPDRREGLSVRVIDPEAGPMLQALESQHPAIGEGVELIEVGGPLHTPASAGRLVSDPSSPLYVCLDDEAEGLQVALDAASIEGRSATTVIQARRATGWSSALGLEGIETFGLFEVACDPDTLFGGFDEELARAIHEAYRVARRADRAADASDGSLAEWTDLAPDLRASNRSQARHIRVKLDRIGADAVPLTGVVAQRFAFTPAEIEQLATIEHDRWWKERADAGWTPGPKSTEKRQSPYLCDYAELPEHIKEYDRNTVRQLPQHVAAVGMQIVRRASDPGDVGGTGS